MKNKINILFYHFTVTPLALGLSKLIKKIYETKKNLLVSCKNEEEMNELNKALWTFSSREFIPHGTINEADPEWQPVLFTIDSHSNKNNAEILLSCCDDIESLNLDFQKYLYAFYGNIEEVQHMLDFYKTCKNRQDAATIFWKQDRNGKWLKEDF